MPHRTDGIGSARAKAGRSRFLEINLAAAGSPIYAQGVLMSITGGSDLGLFEINVRWPRWVQDAAFTPMPTSPAPSSTICW